MPSGCGCARSTTNDSPARARSKRSRQSAHLLLRVVRAQHGLADLDRPALGGDCRLPLQFVGGDQPVLAVDLEDDVGDVVDEGLHLAFAVAPRRIGRTALGDVLEERGEAAVPEGVGADHVVAPEGRRDCSKVTASPPRATLP